MSTLEITEVRMHLGVTDPVPGRIDVAAFCSVTIAGAFVIRDIRVLHGHHGPLVAMPCRKVTDHCPRCNDKNHLRACYCNKCGGPLDPARKAPGVPPGATTGHRTLFVDLAHPANPEMRRAIEEAVLDAYDAEVAASYAAGYVSTLDAARARQNAIEEAARCSC